MLPTLHCIICFYPASWEEISTLSCGHTFHSDCIATWLRGNMNCPICRTSSSMRCSIRPTFVPVDKSDKFICASITSAFRDLPLKSFYDIDGLDYEDTDEANHNYHFIWHSKYLHLSQTHHLFRIEIMFCYICSKYLFAHHLAALYCGHMFHLPCISGWIKNYQYCPVCQKQAGENDIISRLFFSTEKGYNDDDVDGNDYDDDSDDDDSDDDGDDTDDEDDINEDNYDDDDLDEDFIDGDDDIYIQYDDDIMDDGVCANDSLDFSD